MTTNQRLRERYEDALFALIMDGFAKDENEKLLQEQQYLKDSISLDVMTSLDCRSQQTMIRCFAERRKCSARLRRRKVLQGVAAVIALMALLFTTAFAISDEFRISTMNLIITVNEKFTRLDMQETAQENNEASNKDNTTAQENNYFENIKLTCIPEGFTYYSSIYNEEVIFKDESGQWIIVSRFDGNMTYNVDTENAEVVKNVEINGCTGLFILKNGQAHYALANVDKHFYIDVASSEGVPAEKVEKVAYGIVIT